MSNQNQALFTTKEKSSIQVVSGQAIGNGKGFEALSFRENQFSQLMDPLIMVDHFTMTRPTFGTHPHAGMSAVTVMFEDSEGDFFSQDSLGNKIDLQAGDLYWLKAGKGAVHDEAPRLGAHTHALQIFVNLPGHLKHSQPSSQYVRASDIPIFNEDGTRVRVVLGSSNQVSGVQSITSSLTILDASLKANASWTHMSPANENVWIHPVKGELKINLGDHQIQISEKQAIALKAEGHNSPIQFFSKEGAQFVLVSGKPIREKFIQKGPFVMSTQEELEQVQKDYLAGHLGKID